MKVSLWNSRVLLSVAAGMVSFTAQASEHGGPLDMNPGLQIWTIVVFLVLFALLAKFTFKPIAHALDRRSLTIRESIEEAERVRTEAKKLMEGYQQQLVVARTEAGRVVEEARVLGERVRKEIVSHAQTESAALVQRAQEEIQRQQEKGIQELKDTVAVLSVQIASKVIEKEVNAVTHRHLVESLIQDLSKIRKV